MIRHFLHHQVWYYLVVFVLFGLAMVLIAACGDDQSNPAGNNPKDGWTSVEDPLMGNSFRCFTIWREHYNGDGLGGGPAMWCYQVEG